MARRDSKHHQQPRSNPRSKSRKPHAAPGSPPPHPGSSPRAQSSSLAHARSAKAGPRIEHSPKQPRQAEAGGPVGQKLERVQKVLAHAGLGSRRSCEDLIKQGRVSIDGQIVRELGTRVDPARAKVAVDGEAIRLESMVYYAINKPKGYVSTNLDPAGRPRVVDLLPEIPERVYTVGRLDEESTGLMILTNDGELANRLAHPRYGVEKLYRALIAGSPDREILAKLTAGIWLSDGKVRAKRARLVGRQGTANVLELVLAEGKNREIRRMLAKLGHKVMSLNRVAVGPISVKGLSSGECRSLSRHEVELLWKVANGVDVSLPRHLDRDSSSRPPRAANRPRAVEHGRSARDQSGPPRKHQRDAAPKLGTPRSANDGPPRSSNQGRPRSANQGPPRSANPSPPRSSNQGRPPVPPRPNSKTPLPSPPPVRRRIIGLELQQPTLPGPHVKGARGRKRPSPRKQRPSPQAPIRRPIVPFRPPDPDGDDA
jgi:23S rRNA pseudouridine2605 synthase